MSSKRFFRIWIDYICSMASIKKHNRLRVGISCGDINGIGLEVIIKTFSDNRMFEICTPIVYGPQDLCTAYRKELGINDFSFNKIESASKANPKRVNLINIESDAKLQIGSSDNQAGVIAFKALEKATFDLASNYTDVLITAPINKDNIQSDDFKFPGHTEYLANYANEDNPLMILLSGSLRVGVATGHIPIKDVANALTKELIESKIDTLHKSLVQDFGIPKPKIAVLGLNPHAGDNGVIGEEEKTIILPAIDSQKKEGKLVYGPYPADGFFGSSTYKNFDGILAMYHDQGLIPFKTLAFNSGVNYTAGLPIVRTSPDHGVAYDIAGKNLAAEDSFRQAVYWAVDIYKNRRDWKELTANPLVINK